MQELISKATEYNWKRLNLNKTDIEKKLTSRANKRLSTKQITPVEYIQNQQTLELLPQILNCGTIKAVLYSTALNLLNKNKLITLKNFEIQTQKTYLEQILKEYHQEPIAELINLKLPDKERDILGIIYQMYLSEGTKNKSGSYYTPQKILNSIKKEIQQNDKFLDPCCGTGSFLLSASEIIKNPENIYGCDCDEIACFIAKINLILKYKDSEFRPNIFHTDFLSGGKNLPEFDIIATNPPWGALTNIQKHSPIKSGESYSYFIVKSSQYLKKNGKMYFVLPESIMNVKKHADIRKFILENFHIEKIELHDRAFSSVLTNVITITLSKLNTGDIIISGKNNILKLNQKYYEKNIHNNFSIIDNNDAKILEKIYSTPHIKLDKTSIWGLGIVTGNNSKLISKNPSIGEKIYSGKNINKNKITETNNYIVYDRKNFQQCASDKIYRAKEKLVYKFISKKLIFACDDKQRLFLNSANILIPNLEGYDIRTVMTFLNSTLFEYIYTKNFSGLKVLKSSLMELPFPILNGLVKITDETIFGLFNLTDEEISHIKNEVKNESTYL